MFKTAVYLLQSSNSAHFVPANRTLNQAKPSPNNVPYCAVLKAGVCSETVFHFAD